MLDITETRLQLCHRQETCACPTFNTSIHLFIAHGTKNKLSRGGEGEIESFQDESTDKSDKYTDGSVHATT